MTPDVRQDATLTIAGYGDGDFEAVHALWVRSDLWMRPSDGRDQVALKLTRDADLFLVARVDDRTVGTVMGGWDGRRGYVYHLAVDPAWRRRGVADRLMDELEERLRRKGALKVKLQVLDGNETSQRFFAQRGYEVESVCIPYGKELIAGGAPGDGAPDYVSPAGDAPADGGRGASPDRDPDTQGDEQR